MTKRPFKKLDKRMLAVCEIVREHLGLKNVTGFFETGDKSVKDRCASCLSRGEGWEFRVFFYSGFFKEVDIDKQLVVIVHELIHAAMQPYDDMIQRCWEEYVPHKHKRIFRDRCIDSLELMVDHMVTGILNAIRPQLDKIL